MTLGARNGGIGLVHGHIVTFVDPVITDVLVLVGFGEEGREAPVDPGRSSGQTRELRSHAGVRLGHFARPLEDKAFGRVKDGEIGGTGRHLSQSYTHDLSCVGEIASGLVEILARLGLHRSRPSRRSSSIKPMRSASRPKPPKFFRNTAMS